MAFVPQGVVATVCVYYCLQVPVPLVTLPPSLQYVLQSQDLLSFCLLNHPTKLYWQL
jgi:hypothetical protein